MKDIYNLKYFRKQGGVAFVSRKITGVALAFFIFVGGLAKSSFADSSFPDISTDKWYAPMSKRNQHFEVIKDYSKNLKNVGKLTFDPKKNYYGEISLKKRLIIANNEKEFSGFLCFDSFAETTLHFSCFAIRFVDSKGETYQYNIVGSFTEGQWSSWELQFGKEVKPREIYGGDKNKKIDYPIYLSSIIWDGSRYCLDDVVYYVHNLRLKK